MLRYVLDPARWDVEVIAPATLTGELLDRVAEHRPGAVVIATTPPGGLAHTRYLCKRLRSRFPDLKILVGRWGTHDITTTEPASEAGPDRPADALKAATADSATAGPAPADPMIAGLKEAGADFVAATLLETRQQLTSLIPVLVQGPDGRDLAGSEGPRPTGPGRRAGRTTDLEVAAGALTS
jgi:hypothetical protein